MYQSLRRVQSLFLKHFAIFIFNLFLFIYLLYNSNQNRLPYYLNAKSLSLRDIIMKLWGIKETERILKAARGKKNVTYKPSNRLSVISQQKPYRPEKNRMIHLKVWKKKYIYQRRILYPSKLYFRYEGELRLFQGSRSWLSLLPLNPPRNAERSLQIENSIMLISDMKTY